MEPPTLREMAFMLTAVATALVLLPSLTSADLAELGALMTDLEALTGQLVEVVEDKFARRCDNDVVGRAVRSLSREQSRNLALSTCAMLTSWLLSKPVTHHHYATPLTVSRWLQACGNKNFHDCGTKLLNPECHAGSQVPRCGVACGSIADYSTRWGMSILPVCWF
eukprot:COSAG02_NODE_127_length_34879_cov_12.705060_5_plen_166_part_00